jgi:hypothetical protein
VWFENLSRAEEATMTADFRVFGYDEMGECGREAYMYSMAVQYLRRHGIAVPDDLEDCYLTSVHAWLRAIESLRQAELEAHEVSQSGVPPASTTAWVPPDELPGEAQLSPDDGRILRSPDLWTSLDAPARDLLTMRMAVTFVRDDYGGWVPSGLVARTVAAANRT